MTARPEQSGSAPHGGAPAAPSSSDETTPPPNPDSPATVDSRLQTGWRAFASEPHQAVAYLNCIFRAQRWIHRRVDHLSFEDSITIGQASSLDLTIPIDPPTFSLGADTSVVILPLLQVRKSPLVHFSLRGPDQEPVPLLTARQSRTLASHGMLALADLVIGEAALFGTDLRLTSNHSAILGDQPFYQVNDDQRVDLDLPAAGLSNGKTDPDVVRAYSLVQKHIVSLVSGGPEEGLEELAWFEHPVRGSVRAEELASALAGVLWTSLAFRTFLRRLAQNYYVSGVFRPPPQGRARMVLKVRFDRPRRGGSLANRAAPWNSVRTWWRHVGRQLLRDPLESLGIVATSIVHEANQALDCESFHVEFNAPRGLKIVDLDWFLFPPSAVDAQQSEPVAESAGKPTTDMTPARRVTRDLSNEPIVVSPDIIRDGAEPSRVNTAIHPVPLSYGLHVRWRLAASALSWISVALPVALAVVVLQAILSLGVMDPGSAPSWAPTWIRETAGWATLSSSDPGTSVAGVSGDAANDGDVANDDGTEMGTLAQNRAQLLLVVVGVAVALLVRSGEPGATKRILLAPRLAVAGILISVVVAGVPFWLAPTSLGTAWVRTIVLIAFLSSAAMLVLVLAAWLVSVGPVRRIRRRSRRRRRSGDFYWRAAA